MTDQRKNNDTVKTSTANGEVANVAAAINSAEALAGLFGNAQNARFCSFNTTTPEGIFLLDKCEEAPDAKVGQADGQTIELVHVYGHLVPRLDKETGEEVMRLRTCLIDRTGKVWACMSDGIRRSVVRLSLQHGIPPWPKGLRVTIHVQRVDDKTENVRFFLLNALPTTEQPQ